MKKFNKITIIGVGLIGGSIGLAIRKKGVARQVAGVFRHRSTMKKALAHKAIDKGFMTMAEGVAGADLIILATPVHSIPVLVMEALRFAKKGAVITDAGSTKEWIVKTCEKALRRNGRVTFIGSHPMAGSEQTGVAFASAGLFEGSPCIVTKTPATNARALALVTRFWKALGGKVKVMNPADHDRTVALISHLPHIVAFSLAGAVPGKAMACAAEGFKDTTRIASSDPGLWADIFLTNKRAVSAAGRMFDACYKKVMKSVSKGDYAATFRTLRDAKTKRDRFVYGKRS